MPNSTTRLGLVEPLGTDGVPELRISITEHATALDNSYQYMQGLLAALPSASSVPPGTAYWATDSSMMFHAVGGSGGAASVWINTMFSPGDLKSSASSTVPTGWLLCNGQTVSSTTYAALYTAIGTAYGGNSTNFAVPDLCGRVPLGAAASSGQNASTATSASTWTLGSQPTGTNVRGGEETHGLSEAELAAHSHGGNTVTGYASVGTNTGYANIEYSDPAGGRNMASVPSNISVSSSDAQGHSSGGNLYVPVASADVQWGYNVGLNHNHGDGGHSHGAYDTGHYHGIPSDGSGSAHNTVPPVSVVNWFIKY